MIKKLIYIVLLLFLSLSVKANKALLTLSDSAQISLLTNNPDNSEIFRLYGHTAIRVNDSKNNLDVVFNYGVFNFDTPDFLYQFIKGETDYIVAEYNFKDYLAEYKYRGISVFEQVFNLTQEEKQQIWEALYTNSLPENRFYRYNFFFDNCSTRPRNIIENNVSGVINYSPTNISDTFRDLVHRCVDNESWIKFGIDLVIGSGADSIISDRHKMFLPQYLMNAYENSTITRQDSTYNLIAKEGYILDFNHKTESNSDLSVIIISIAILFITVIFTILTYKKKRGSSDKIFDFILFFVYGLAGCIIAFLVFLSEHPGTSPNWNLVWLNPVQLIAAFLFFPKSFSKCIYYYHFINFVLLVLFLISWNFIPQYLDIVFIPYILTMCIRSGTNIVKIKRMKL